MDRIYNDAKDKNVAKVIIYIGIDENEETAYAYSDSKLTKKMTTSELEDAFYKGCIARYFYNIGSDIYSLDFSPVNYYRNSDSSIGNIVGVGQLSASGKLESLIAQSIPDPT
nr:MAG TPA: hypothetical protein [Caudoviricetes sp.]